ncbi:MAG: fluoride efflux transporter CrcB [Dysgonamonadaceae bacterium]|jgi:CrcB protein|nr:fluoride efflux transporter CrcB [Dysgonamonadaceae bacterium]
MFKLFSLVFIGGGLGSVARFGVARLFAQFMTSTLPVATFSVNIIGSFLIGLFWAIPLISDKNSGSHLLIIGFCGGFTTFSAFSWENFNLLKQGDILLFCAYATLSVVLCLLATWGGYTVGKCIY